MPIIRMAGRLVYFAHVPKCGGTAISSYLEGRFGPLAFRDRRYLSIPQELRWSRSSPQHVAVENLDRLFPPGFFDASFAMVRHPVDRLASVFLFQLETEKTVPPGTRFSDWLRGLGVQHQPFLYDNHIRPMTELVPEAAAVFRLEAGMGPVIDWIDRLVLARSEPESAAGEGIGQTNHRALRLERNPGLARVFRASPQDRALIGDLYAADFARFGYDPAGPTTY
jgi:hypothetical protein